MSEIIPVSQYIPDQKRNFYSFGLDYIFFGLSLGFVNLHTILPAFARQLGMSIVTIGLLITLLSLAWTLPQIFAGNITARQYRKKPMLLKAVFIGRPLTIIVPIIIFFTGAKPAWLSFVSILVIYAAFFVADAFAAVPWFDLIGRSFPSNRRGHYISLWQVGKAVGLLGVSFMVERVLSMSGPPFPNNYVLLFAGASACLLVSAAGLIFLREPETEANKTTVQIEWRKFRVFLKRIWFSETRFRRIIIARILFSFSIMALPFYVLYATDVLAFPERMIGYFILAQTVGASLGGLILGRIADKHGAKEVIMISAILVLSAPILALMLAAGNGAVVQILKYAYVWIYICIGLIDNSMMLGFLNYALDVTSAEQRPLYMGMYQTLASVGLLGSTIAGWLVTQTSYSVLFAVSIVFGIISLLMARRLPVLDQNT